MSGAKKPTYPPPSAHASTFLMLYGLSALYIFHKMLIGYSNSSYIERLTAPETIGLLYAVGSAGAIAGLLYAPSLFHYVNGKWVAALITLIEIVALVLVGLDLTPPLTISAFVISLVLMPAVGLVIDLLAETTIGDNEDTTGSRWALMLSAMSIVSIMATLTLAGVVGEDPDRLRLTYFISAIALLVLLIVVQLVFRRRPLPAPRQGQFLSSLKRLWHTKNLRYAYLSRLTLSLLFGTVAIYLPLYLVQEFGFSWTIIGLLFATEMGAYLVTEYPIGWLADRRWGEVEMLVTGFLISTGVMLTLSLLTTTAIWVWFSLFFAMGFGGSLIETTLVSYYYKHTKATDVDLISFFRTTTPFAAGIGALLGSAILLYLSFSAIFLGLAGLLLIGVACAVKLQDTR